MALSGRISKAITGRTYYIDWSATQSISGNYSTITCKHYLKNNSSYSLYINGRSNTCSVGGVSDDFTSAAISTGGGSTIHLGTTTHKVNHNADGSKSVTIKGVFNIQATLSGTYYSSLTASGTVTLDTIPRAASITSAPNFTDEDNPTIKYSNAAGSVVDALYAGIYGTDGSTEYAAYRSISETGTSYTFELTDEEREALIAACTTAKSMTVRFYLRTALGGTNYNKYVEKTLTIANAEPALAPTVEDTNATTKALTGDEAKFIKGYSNAAFTVGASALKGASIKSQGVTCGAKSSTAASGTLSAVESGTFTFTATDSRGYTTTKKLTKTLIEYVKLTCTLKANNPTADGDMTMKISGAYFNGSFGATANALTVQYRMSEDGGSTWGDWTDATATLSGNSYSASVALTGLDYQTAYTFQARAVDKLATVNTATKTVKATPVFDWGEDEFNFNVPVTVDGNITVGSTTKLYRNGAFVRQFSKDTSNAVSLIEGRKADGSTRQFFIGAHNTGGSGGTGAIYLIPHTPTNDLWSNTEGLYIGDKNLCFNGRNLLQNKVLWSGAYYMKASQTATLSEAVSEQPHGIVCVWSWYTGSAAGDYRWSAFFVPKYLVANKSTGGGIYMGFVSDNYHMGKQLVFADTTLTGVANNASTLTNGGVTVTNGSYVLRYVIGV